MGPEQQPMVGWYMECERLLFLLFLLLLLLILLLPFLLLLFSFFLGRNL